MPVRIIPPTASAYAYPLLIKHLLHSSMVRAPDQEIVYRDLRRHTYREFRERIGRLGQVNNLVSNALSLANAGGPYRFCYYLPGKNAFTGSTWDDVTIVVVR